MVFLVEDDDSIRELVCYALRSAGFEVMGFEDAESFWKQMSHQLPAIVLLDIMLPGENGLSVLRRLKDNPKTAYLPVIMLTAMGTEHDRILGLDTGADDYIAKPFSVLEMLARVRALLRRSGQQKADGTAIQIGDLSLDTTKRTVHVLDEEVALTLKEFELLHCLMRHNEAVLTRDQLFTQIWGYEYESTNRTVDMHIKTVRQKLGCCGEMIKTIRGLGYKITAG